MPLQFWCLGDTGEHHQVLRCKLPISHALLMLHYVGAPCNELLWCAQERELQADLQQLLAQLVVGAGQPHGPPALPSAVQQTAKRVLGHSCAVASFSPADSAQLQLLSWLADAQVSTMTRSFVTARVEAQPLCYTIHRTDSTLDAISGETSACRMHQRTVPSSYPG